MNNKIEDRTVMGKLVVDHSSIVDPISEICSELKAHTIKTDICFFIRRKLRKQIQWLFVRRICIPVRSVNVAMHVITHLFVEMLQYSPIMFSFYNFRVLNREKSY